MRKEEAMMKAYNQVASKGIVGYADKEVDFAVLKSYISDYAQKNQLDVTDSEITSFITKQFENVKEMTSDFSYQTKMMN